MYEGWVVPLHYMGVQAMGELFPTTYHLIHNVTHNLGLQFVIASSLMPFSTNEGS